MCVCVCVWMLAINPLETNIYIYSTESIYRVWIETLFNICSDLVSECVCFMSDLWFGFKPYSDIQCIRSNPTLDMLALTPPTTIPTAIACTTIQVCNQCGNYPYELQKSAAPQHICFIFPTLGILYIYICLIKSIENTPPHHTKQVDIMYMDTIQKYGHATDRIWRNFFPHPHFVLTFSIIFLHQSSIYVYATYIGFICIKLSARKMCRAARCPYIARH